MTMRERMRRVVLALDAVAAVDEALEHTGPVAETLDAEVRGLFVEDARLLELTAAMDLVGVDVLGRPRRFDHPSARRAQGVAAEIHRERLESAADRWRIAWSFVVERGTFEDQVREADADAVVIAPTRRRARRPDSRVVVALDRPHEPAVDLARRLADRGAVLCVVPAGEPTIRQSLAERAGADARLGFVECEEVAPAAVAEIMATMLGYLLVAPADPRWLSPAALALLRPRGPVVLLR